MPDVVSRSSLDTPIDLGGLTAANRGHRSDEPRQRRQHRRADALGWPSITPPTQAGLRELRPVLADPGIFSND